MIAVRVDGDVPRVEATGAVTEADVSLLQSVLRELAESMPARVVVDLRGAIDIHPTALGVLISAERGARARGVKFAVCAGSRVVAMWDAMGLAGIVPTFESLKAALAATHRNGVSARTENRRPLSHA